MTKTCTVAVLFVFLVIFADPAAADFYKWVDERGVVHFSDTPPKSRQEIETIETPDYPPSSAGVEMEEPDDAAPAPEKPAIKRTYRPKKQKKTVNDKVEIFTTDW